MGYKGSKIFRFASILLLIIIKRNIFMKGRTWRDKRLFKAIGYCKGDK